MGKLTGFQWMRIIALVYGLFVIGIGYFGFSMSSWMVGCFAVGSKHGEWCAEGTFYKTCLAGKQPDLGQLPQSPDAKLLVLTPCPHPAMEQLHIAIIILTLLLSLTLYIGSFFVQSSDSLYPRFQKIDYWYNAVSAGALILGAILFLGSAVWINSIYSMEWEDQINKATVAVGVGAGFGLSLATQVHFRFIVKLVAAIFALGLAGLYFAMAKKIKKAMKESANNAAGNPSVYAGDSGLEQNPTQDEVNQLSQNPSAVVPQKE